MTAGEMTVRPGQWLRHLTNAPERPWRYLEEITPDPLGNSTFVVLKFSNGDGERMSHEATKIFNGTMFDSAQIMWEISDGEPVDDVATKRLTGFWLTLGELVSLEDCDSGFETWSEARLRGEHGEFLVEIPAAALEQLHGDLTLDAQVEVVTPALSTGEPGILEVRVGSKVWADPAGVPVTRGFLDKYDLVAKADESGCDIVPHVCLDHP